MRTIEWPFRGAEAVDSGSVTFRELRRFHAGVYPGVWVPREVELTAVQRARAAWLWSGRAGVLAGLSASAVLGGRWIYGDTPAELIHGNRRPAPGIVVHSDGLDPWEVKMVGGMAVTTAARTGFDLGRRLPLTEGVPRIDALLNATHVKVADIEHILAARPGARGVRQLKQTLALVDGGAESPYESMTRMLLGRKDFLDQRRRSWYAATTDRCSPASTWDGGNGAWASISRASTIGPTRGSVTGTSSGTPGCPNSTGSISD